MDSALGYELRNVCSTHAGGAIDISERSSMARAAGCDSADLGSIPSVHTK